MKCINCRRPYLCLSALFGSNDLPTCPLSPSPYSLHPGTGVLSSLGGLGCFFPDLVKSARVVTDCHCPPKDLRAAVHDLVVILECLQHKHKGVRQGPTSQLMVLCNRTAVYDQLLQHGFHTTWQGGIRVSTVSSAAGATARVAVVVQTGCGFLSGGRKNATPDDKEDSFGRATVALTRAIQLTYLLSPVEMAGLVGVAQVLAVFHRILYLTTWNNALSWHHAGSYRFGRHL